MIRVEESTELVTLKVTHKPSIRVSKYSHCMGSISSLSRTIGSSNAFQ